MSSMPGASSFVIVDVEATTGTPMTGVMSEFGAVELVTGRSFYGQLWPSDPDPGNPALHLIPDGATPEAYARFMTEAGGMLAVDLGEDLRALFVTFADWLATFNGRVTFVSDNPSFDFMWVACGFDQHGLPNPFGHSGRRIGDLAAGLSGRWRDAQSWKRRRVTRHDHNPVNDAMGNVEALRSLLDDYGQEWRSDNEAA